MLMNEREEKMTVKTPHNIIINEGEACVLDWNHADIDSFDEQTVLLFTGLGELAIRGENLHINRIDVDTGEVNLEGEIDSLTYADNQPNKGGFFGKLFK